MPRLPPMSVSHVDRAAHPLFTYTEPERVNDMVKSFIAFYEQNG